MEGSEPGYADPYGTVPLTNGSGSGGGPKTSGSGTLVIVNFFDPDPHRFCSDCQPFNAAFMPTRYVPVCFITYYLPTGT
jgi:hypothetical protein